MTIKDENYFVVHGWMRTKLHLKGNELLVYSVVYGFSQDGLNEFRGSIDYITELIGASEKTIRSTLESLVTAGLVKKVARNKEKGETNGYVCIPLDDILGGGKNYHPPGKNYQPGRQKLPTGVVKITDNKEVYKEEYKEVNNSKQVSNLKKEELNNNACARESCSLENYDDILDDFGVTGLYRQALFRFIAHLKVNYKTVMLNERLKTLIIRMDRYYDRDVDKAEAIDDAIAKGYRRLGCEEAA